MKNHCSPLRIALLISAGLLLTASRAPAQEVKWRYSYNEARKEAKEKGLPLILDFYKDQCVWCDKLDQYTLRDPAVSRLINEQFVALKVHGERETALSSVLHITAYPTVVFADPDGKILGTIEGFKEAGGFYEMLQRTLARVANPEWMVRDYQKAETAFNKSDYGSALALLKNIVEDGRTRPIQERSRQLQNVIEKQAATRMVQARQLTDRNQTDEAVKALTEVVRLYPGTQEARDAGDLLTRMVQRDPVVKTQNRERRARELLAQAKEDYRTKQYLCCLDRCEVLSDGFGDLPEGVEAMQLAAEIRSNPEWLQKAYDSLEERAANIILALADCHMKKGQPQQAVQWYERLAQRFPGSQQAEVARLRTSQIRGEPTRPVDFQKQ